jgi:hypothetical protein
VGVTSHETRIKLPAGVSPYAVRGQIREIRSSTQVENVVPRSHDFEGPLCDTAAFPRLSRNFKMNSSELVTIVAEAHDLSKAQAQAILDSVLKSIVNAAASDDEVSLAGFG